MGTWVEAPCRWGMVQGIFPSGLSIQGAEKVTPIKIIVDWDLCESNFQCNEACPDLFQIDEANDELVVTAEQVPEHLVTQAQAAELRCPKGAIRLVEGGA